MKCPHCNGTGELAPEATNIGSMVLSLRKARDMSQVDLAARASISRGQLANLETGRTDPSLKLMYRLAEALGCSPKDLIP